MSARDLVPDSLARTFFDRTRGLDQRRINWLTKRHGVLVLALAGDGHGGKYTIGSARVEKVGRRFQFRPEDGDEALIVVARDELGYDLDLVAYHPRAGWVAPWLGDAGLLGLQDMLSQRFVDPLAVHRDALGWLRAGRNGVVVLNPREARRQLAGYTLAAEDIEHGLRLKRLLEGPTPRIVVAASAHQQAA